MKPALRTKVITKLDYALEEVENKFPDINYGGCGVFALILYSELKSLGANPKLLVSIGTIVSMSKSIVRKANQCKNLEQLDNLLDIGHIFVQVGRRYIDSTGVHYTKYDISFTSRCIPLTVEALNTMAHNSKGWNEEFNRRRTPAIRRTVHKIFEQIRQEVQLAA